MCKIIEELLKDNEFMSALRYGEPLSESEVTYLKSRSFKISDNFDEYIRELYEIDFDGKRFWLQHLKSDGKWWIFGSVCNTEQFLTLQKYYY